MHRGLPSLFCAALVTTFLATPMALAAECLTAESIDLGVQFLRSDGHSGTAVRRDGKILIDYAAEDGVRIDARQTELGIYEIAMTQLFIDEPSMGAGTEMFAQRFAGKLAEPVVGGGWQGKVKVKFDADNPSVEGSLAQDWVWQADFSFLPEITGKLSGCSYRAIPVEVRFNTAERTFDQRFLYFPDLGFGLETKRDGVTNKVMSLKLR